MNDGSRTARSAGPSWEGGRTSGASQEGVGAGYSRLVSGPRDLRAVVESYQPHGDDVSHRIALDALSTGRPMWPRGEFDPGHFTASGFVLSPDRESLLLILHGKLDRWLQPGGHIERDDISVEAAARREIEEETGLAAVSRVGSDLARIDAHLIPQRGSEPRHIHIDLAVGFVAETDALGPFDEVLDARWVPLGGLADYDVDDAVLSGVHRLIDR